MSSTSPTATVTLNATLTDKANNPLSNESISFSYQLTTATSWTAIGSATTNSSGLATTQVTLAVPAAYNFQATFAGDSNYNPKSAEVTDLIIKADTVLNLVVVP